MSTRILKFIGIALLVLGLGYGSFRLVVSWGEFLPPEVKESFVKFDCGGKTFAECQTEYHKQADEVFKSALERMKLITEEGQPKSGNAFDPITEPSCREYKKEQGESAAPTCVALKARDLYAAYEKEVERCFLSNKLINETYKCTLLNGEEFENENVPTEFSVRQAEWEKMLSIINFEMRNAREILGTALVVYDERYRDYAFHIDQLRIIAAAKKYREQMKKITGYTQALPRKFNLATSATCAL
jgi:hypothetical protein